MTKFHSMDLKNNLGQKTYLSRGYKCLSPMLAVKMRKLFSLGLDQLFVSTRVEISGQDIEQLNWLFFKKLNNLINFLDLKIKFISLFLKILHILEVYQMLL